jgi:hypothetical protein
MTNSKGTDRTSGAALNEAAPRVDALTSHLQGFPATSEVGPTDGEQFPADKRHCKGCGRTRRASYDGDQEKHDALQLRW